MWFGNGMLMQFHVGCDQWHERAKDLHGVLLLTGKEVSGEPPNVRRRICRWSHEPQLRLQVVQLIQYWHNIQRKSLNWNNRCNNNSWKYLKILWAFWGPRFVTWCLQENFVTDEFGTHHIIENLCPISKWVNKRRIEWRCAQVKWANDHLCLDTHTYRHVERHARKWNVPTHAHTTQTLTEAHNVNECHYHKQKLSDYLITRRGTH